jgi:hypothetical protein
VHSAASQDEASLHITIGVGPVVWATAIQYAVQHAALDDMRLRQALPLGFAVGAGPSAVRSGLAELVAQVSPGLSAAAVIDKAEREARCALPVLADHLRDLEGVKSADLTTRVCRRDGVSWTLATEAEATSLEFSGKTIRLPVRLAGELEYITGAEEFTPSDIPGELDQAGRMVLVTTLVREGFLTLA